MIEVIIDRMNVIDIPGKTHCWVPIIDGRAIQYKNSPPWSVRAAKRASAIHLGIDPREMRDRIKFTIHR
jgi:hypothetical protein